MNIAGVVIVGIVVLVHIVRSMIVKAPLNRVLLWRAGLGVVLGIIMIGVSELDIVKFQYRDHPAYVEAYQRYREDPNDESWRKLELEYQKVMLMEK